MTGCTSLSVQSDFNESVDFSSYQTFSFISDHSLILANLAPVNPLLEGRLREATARVLSAKGYRLIENREEADFVVSFTVRAELQHNKRNITRRNKRNIVQPNKRILTQHDKRNIVRHDRRNKGRDHGNTVRETG